MAEKEEKRGCEERPNQGEVTFSLSLSAHTQSSLSWRQMDAEGPPPSRGGGSPLLRGSTVPRSPFPGLRPTAAGLVAMGGGGPRAPGASHGPLRWTPGGGAGGGADAWVLSAVSRPLSWSPLRTMAPASIGHVSSSPRRGSRLPPLGPRVLPKQMLN